MGIRELRLNLSQTIREVERGESVEVTRDGEPVALIVPMRERHQARSADRGGTGQGRRCGPSISSGPWSSTTGEMTASEALEWLRGER